MSQPMSIDEQVLYSHWAKEKSLILNGKSYRVGKMSYGDYFLEPGPPRGEWDGFNRGTIWPKVNRTGKR